MNDPLIDALRGLRDARRPRAPEALLARAFRAPRVRRPSTPALLLVAAALLLVGLARGPRATAPSAARGLAARSEEAGLRWRALFAKERR